MLTNNNYSPFYNLVKRGYKARRNSHKAATLLITVLISVVAASIAMSLVRVIMENGSSNGESVRFTVAKNQAFDNLQVALSQLNKGNLILYKEVLPNEAPRICSPLNTTINPAESWPLACGTSWSYGDTSNLNKYIEFNLDMMGSSKLGILSVVKDGSIKIGYRAVAKLGESNTPAIYSYSDIDLKKLSSNVSNQNLTGTFYSNGSLLNWDQISSSNALFLSESTFSPTPSASDDISGYNGNKFASSKVDKNKHIYSIRNFSESLLDNTTYRSSLSSLISYNCQNTTSSNLIYNNKNYSSSLCLTTGASIINTTGLSITIPESSSFLIIPEGDHKLGLYYPSSELYDPIANCGDCDLQALLADQYNSEREAGPLPPNPGFLSSYTKLGSFYYPLNNIISSNTDLIVGFCGEGFLGNTCDSNNGNVKSNFEESLSVIAGNLTTPKNIIVGQSLASTSGRINLIASDHIIIPYWSISQGGSLVVNANFFTFSNSKTITTNPQNSTSLNNVAGSLFYQKGSLYSSQFNINIDNNLFSSYKIEPASDELTPFTPRPTSRWELIKVDRVAKNNIS